MAIISIALWQYCDMKIGGNIPMEIPNHQVRKENTVEFLLREIEHAENERVRLKSEAVQRLNFFLTLTSALLGGVVILGPSLNKGTNSYLLLAILFFLCIVGWQNFQFTIERDIHTDGVIRTIARLRRYFTDDDPVIRKYLTWQDHDEPSKYIAHNSSSIRRTMEAVVAFLIAAILIVSANVFGIPISLLIIIGVISFGIILTSLEIYSRQQFMHAVKKAHSEKRFSGINI